MSQVNNDNGDAETRVKQEVTVIGYAEKGKYADERAFAQQLDDSHDYWDTMERSETLRGVWVNGEQVMSGLSAKKVTRAFELDVGERVEFESDEGQHMVAKVWEESEEGHRWNTSVATKEMLIDFEEKVEDGDGVSGLEAASFGSCQWQDDDSVTKARISKRGVKPQRVLVPQDERTPDNRFKGDDKVMAVQFNIKLGEASEEQVEQWYNEVVLPFLKHVRRWDEIDNVEMTDCETQKVEQGDCFDF